MRKRKKVWKMLQKGNKATASKYMGLSPQGVYANGNVTFSEAECFRILKRNLSIALLTVAFCATK